MLCQIASTSFNARPLLPSWLLKALKNLCNDSYIIIKPVDKNLGLVVLDKLWYKYEGLRQLSDVVVYASISAIPWEVVHNILVPIIDRFPFFLKGISKFLL